MNDTTWNKRDTKRIMVRLGSGLKIHLSEEQVPGAFCNCAGARRAVPMFVCDATDESVVKYANSGRLCHKCFCDSMVAAARNRLAETTNA